MADSVQSYDLFVIMNIALAFGSEDGTFTAARDDDLVGPGRQ